jgi:acyl-CoA thioester hydrolase
MSRDALTPRAAYRHWSTMLTRWADNDVYGHVNNTVHYQWFDTVVNSWLIDNGLLDIERGDPIGLVVETRCRYAASVAFPETLDIGLMITKLGNSSVTYQLGVFRRGENDAVAQGHFTHVYVARGRRRPAQLPQAWRERFSTLLAAQLRTDI